MKSKYRTNLIKFTIFNSVFTVTSINIVYRSITYSKIHIYLKELMNYREILLSGQLYIQRQFKLICFCDLYICNKKLGELTIIKKKWIYIIYLINFEIQRSNFETKPQFSWIGHLPHMRENHESQIQDVFTDIGQYVRSNIFLRGGDGVPAPIKISGLHSLGCTYTADCLIQTCPTQK